MNEKLHEQITRQKKVVEIHQSQENWETNKDNNQFLNPLIDTMTEDTLSHVSSALSFIQESLTRREAEDELILYKDLEHGLYMINKCIINAINFEEERVSLIKKGSKAQQH